MKLPSTHRKYTFAMCALSTIAALVAYALFQHEGAAAVAGLTAMGGIGALFQHVQGRCDVAETQSTVGNVAAVAP